MFRSIATAAAAVALVVGTAGAAAAHGGHEEGSADHGRALPSGARAQLAHLATAMAPYADPAVAVSAGYIPTDVCVENDAGTAGMGYHYFNPLFFFGPPDPQHPPVLVYVPTANGPRLGAAEWGAIDGDQDLATDDDRPSVLGMPFDGPMLGHEPGQPIHYDLHAWLFTPNPDGVMTPYNPKVHCP